MESVNPEILAARARLRERVGEGTRVGGKNSARLKRRPLVHKSTLAGDKKLQSTIKRMGLSQLPGVDEVAMICENDKAVCFNQPKVQVAINANTFVISGIAEEKSTDQLLSSVPTFSPDILKKFASEWQKMQELSASGGDPNKREKLNKNPEAVDQVSADDDDDDVPNLVNNFDTIASIEECT